MSRRVGNGSQSAAEMAEKSEAFEIQPIDNSHQIPEPRIEREVPGGAVGGAGPTFVVADNLEACGCELITATPGEWELGVEMDAGRI